MTNSVAGNFAVLRTPLLAFSSYQEAWVKAVESGELTEARVALKNIYTDPEVSEAIRVASPSLSDRLQKWDPLDDSSRAAKTAYALYRYVSRMAYRCTPFGLFAGVSTIAIAGTNSDKPSVTLSTGDKYRRQVRLDMTIIDRIVDKILADRNLRSRARYILNPTLHFVGDRWHYIRSTSFGVAQSTFRLAFVEKNEPLTAVFDALTEVGGSISFLELDSALIKVSADSGEAERHEFLHELIDGELLLSTISPCLTNGDPLVQIKHAIAGVSSYWLDKIVGLEEALTKLNSKPLGMGTDCQVEAENLVLELVGGDTATNVLQTDLFKPVEKASLPSKLIKDVEEILDVLLVLSPSTPSDVSSFARDFQDRYGDRWIPLLDAIDPERGIGFGRAGDDQPLVAALPIEFKAQTSAARTMPWSPLVTYLMGEVDHACRSGLYEIEISDRIINQLKDSQIDRLLPSSSYALVTVNDDASGKYEYLVSVRLAGGPSAANLMSRFCWGDEVLMKNVSVMMTLEEKVADMDGVTIAEIIHCPGGRIENVLIRPEFFAHEIPLCGRSSAREDHQILLRDIVVSVLKDKVILRSSKTGRQILPRLTSAHNYRGNNLPAYEFLCALQRQEERLSSFSWPSIFASVARLPRVTYRNCVLAPQRWNFSEKVIETISRASKAEARIALNKLRSELMIPRFVELVESDNRLLIDLDNPLAVDCFISEIEGKPTATLYEAHVSSNNLGTSLVSGREGEYCHELLIPFSKKPTTENKKDLSGSDLTHLIRPERRSAVDTWYYLKIFCGVSVSDRLLIENVWPGVAELVKTAAVDRWFFIRYVDPKPHLRVRCRVADVAEITHVEGLMKAALASAVSDGRIWSVEVSRYEPETVRYGGPAAMDLCEALFQLDSESTLSLLVEKEFVEPSKRWQVILYLTDQLWRSFGYDDQELEDRYNAMSLSFRAGQRYPRPLKVAADRLFRETRSSLDRLLKGKASEDSIYSIMARRARDFAPIARSIRRLSDNGELGRPLHDIVSSLAHMSIDRLTLSSNTSHEVAIYELLCRYYRMERSRSKIESPR